MNAQIAASRNATGSETLHDSACAAGAPRTAPEVDDTPVGGARRCTQPDRGRRGPCAPARPPPHSLRRGAGRGRAGGAAGRTSPPRCADVLGVCRSVTGPAAGLAAPGRGGLSRQRPDCTTGHHPRTCAAELGIPVSRGSARGRKASALPRYSATTPESVPRRQRSAGRYLERTCRSYVPAHRRPGSVRRHRGGPTRPGPARPGPARRSLSKDLGVVHARAVPRSEWQHSRRSPLGADPVPSVRRHTPVPLRTAVSVPTSSTAPPGAAEGRPKGC